MRNIVLKLLVFVILTGSLFIFSGCKMEIEATDNTVSASVDGDTTERVDSVLDWIKARIKRVFDGDVEETNTQSPSTQA